MQVIPHHLHNWYLRADSGSYQDHGLHRSSIFSEMVIISGRIAFKKIPAIAAMAREVSVMEVPATVK